MEEMRSRAAALGLVFIAVAAAGCASQSSPAPAAPPPPGPELTMPFTFDAPAGAEQYECFGFDASRLGARWLTGIDWTPPSVGTGAELHHASLYALPEDYPDGPVPCDSMPTALTMHIWVPGGSPLTLPAGVAIELPTGTQRFVVQVHVLRVTPGPAGTSAVTVHATDVQPEHLAAWLPVSGTVPPLPPHLAAHTATTCIAGSAMHVLTTTPHMHLLGTSFEGAFVAADGGRSVIVDVPTWSFDHQASYPVGRDLAAGDGVETDCTWMNTTDSYVASGSATNDEMCAQALIVWPAQAVWEAGCK
jgi:hypothetical protein